MLINKKRKNGLWYQLCEYSVRFPGNHALAHSVCLFCVYLQLVCCIGSAACSLCCSCCPSCRSSVMGRAAYVILLLFTCVVCAILLEPDVQDAFLKVRTNLTVTFLDTIGEMHVYVASFMSTFLSVNFITARIVIRR